MQVEIAFFAQAADLAGARKRQLTLPDGATVADVRAQLAELAAGPLSRYAIAVNEAYAQDDVALHSGDMLAVIPPVSGGEDALYVHIGPEEIDIADLYARTTSSGCGGHVLFIGSVRDTFDGRATTALQYEAYQDMAERELRAITNAAAARHGARLAVAHRVGWLSVGEIAVAISASAAHRDAAFAACRETIEELKKRVPIWKRERFAEGDASWHSELNSPT